MDAAQPNPVSFAAQVLRAGAESLGAEAAETLLERWPDLARRYGDQSFETWRRHFAERIRQIAAAVAVGRPALFGEQIAWARLAFEARGVDASDLERTLDALRETLESAAPAPAAGPVRECFDRALESARAPLAAAPASLRADTPEGRVGAAYLAAVLGGDRRAASRVVLDAVRAGMSTRAVYLDVLSPVQHELGRMWHMNEISVAEEHFATATTKAVMCQLQPLSDVKPPNGKTVVIAAVEGNAHDVGLQVVSDFLEMEGWRVIFLGPNVPAEDVAVAAETFHADLLALGANLSIHLESLKRTIAAVRGSTAGGVRILVGGLVFRVDDRLWRELGADGFALDAASAVAEAARLAG